MQQRAVCLLARVTIALLLLATLGRGAEGETNPPKRFWWASVAVLGAASAADAGTSWGRQELNPLLRGPDGRFGARAIGIKAALVGTTCVVEWLILRRRPGLDKTAAAVNLGIASATAAVAVRNSR